MMNDEGGDEKMGKLNDFAKENSRFFKISDGETIEAVFEGFTIGKSSFDPERNVVSYSLKTDEGKKIWNSSSPRVASFFDKANPGQTVSIHRTGEGTNTKYDLAIVEKTGSDDYYPEEPESSKEEV